MNSDALLTIVMPVYNEESTIRTIVDMVDRKSVV